MVKARTYFLIRTFTQESIKKESQTGRVSTLGVTVQSMLESLKMDLNMGRVSGRVQKVLSVTSMRGTMPKTRSTVTVCFNGQVATCIRESTRMMRGMGMER